MGIAFVVVLVNTELLAYVLFHETLTVVRIGGAVLILVGIYLAARAEGR